MNDYCLDFIFHDGWYSLTVISDYKINAPTMEEALSKAAEMEARICQFIKVEFNCQTDDFAIEVQNNKYFKNAFIHEYTLYDSKNRKDIYVTKKQFIELLKHDYQNYLKKKNRLSFEANAYGVIPFKQIQNK